MAQQTVNQTSKGFYTFAENLIDYAGLFPPANLDLSTVVKNYTSYRKSPYSWMLGKLICPVKRLKEMGKLLEDYELDTPVEAIGLVTTEGSFEEVRDEIEEFHDVYGKIAHVTSTEAKYAKHMLELSTLYDSFIETVDPKDIPAIAEAKCGLKIRCGGISPSDFPTAESLANRILIAINNEVKLKFTAGLHHPLHHASSSMGCNMHGFINIFSGALFTKKYDLTQKKLEEILIDGNFNNFRFDDQGIHWRDLSIDTNSLKSMRYAIAQSYGSCSFDEPITDLKTIGWLS